MAIKNHGKCTGEKKKNAISVRTLSREYDCLAKIGTNEAFTLLLKNCCQRATCANSNWQSKTKIYEKNHLLLRILAVIGRYGSHLMIVMIFLTQNNLKRRPGISDRLLGFFLLLFLVGYLFFPPRKIPPPPPCSGPLSRDGALHDWLHTATDTPVGMSLSPCSDHDWYIRVPAHFFSATFTPLCVRLYN